MALFRRSRAVGAPPLAPPSLTPAVSAERDHIRGAPTARITLVEYGDYECPYCGQAYPVVRELRDELGPDLRVVFRNLPLAELHPHAVAAALAAEAAGRQGRFWEMHDLLFAHQAELNVDDLRGYARRLGLDPASVVGPPAEALLPRLRDDVASATASGAPGTPTFFLNGARYSGGLDAASMAAAGRSLLA